MTVEELEQKVNASQEKVQKRLNTISKYCKKLNISYDELLNDYNDKKPSSYKGAKELVNKYVQEKETRTADGKYDNDAYDYNVVIDNLTESLTKLTEVYAVLNNWTEKLNAQKSKENVKKIQVLVDFLNSWEENAKDYFHELANAMVDKMNDFHTVAYDYLNELGYTSDMWKGKEDIIKKFNDYVGEKFNVRNKYTWSVSAVSATNIKEKFPKLVQELTTVGVNVNSGKYDQNFGYSFADCSYYIKDFDDEKLNKILEQEKQAKYDELVARLTSVVGEITDVSNLSIGHKNGELNGTVYGTKGTAKVETVGAGGYNDDIIVNVKHGQHFHYRVLVKKVN